MNSLLLVLSLAASAVSQNYRVVKKNPYTWAGPLRMAVGDADSGKVITTIPIGDHVDATVVGK